MLVTVGYYGKAFDISDSSIMYTNFGRRSILGIWMEGIRGHNIKFLQYTKALPPKNVYYLFSNFLMESKSYVIIHDAILNKLHD